VLVIVNKLKPYKYVDKTLKGIQSSKNQNPIKSIDSDQMKKQSNEDSEDKRKIEIIGTY
jgi:hypothetical protein